MRRAALVSEARLRTIERRQLNMRWGKDYEPAMRATRDEAPAVSKPSTVYSRLLGREVHVMSKAERTACLLALYHPSLFDLHEQHMLSPYPEEHPLAMHPNFSGQTYPKFEGTIAVTERLGAFKAHKIVVLNEQDEHGEPEQVRVAFPYTGDLLLFLKDADGPYCVNWTVKKSEAGFSTKFESLKNPHKGEEEYASAELRHQIEREYFADAGIPTHRIAETLIDKDVRQNLTMLFVWQAKESNLTSQQRARIIERYQEILGTRTCVMHVLSALIADLGCTRQECLVVLYQSIWTRELRVDLHRPILPDSPLRPERTDVLDEYIQWFGR